jgi:hypothetical protein
VSSDAAATAQNFKDFEFLFRMGFVGYLIEAVCDIALSLILYVLLRPVRKDIALLASFFGLVGTAVFATSEHPSSLRGATITCSPGIVRRPSIHVPMTFCKSTYQEKSGTSSVWNASWQRGYNRRGRNRE